MAGNDPLPAVSSSLPRQIPRGRPHLAVALGLWSFMLWTPRGAAQSDTPSDPSAHLLAPCNADEHCDDFIACTLDVCDEFGLCINAQSNSLCDNGVFCDGAEVCTPTGCVMGGPPCGAGQTCDEFTDQCGNPNQLGCGTGAAFGVVIALALGLVKRPRMQGGWSCSSHPHRRETRV
jgi:hypothetical protein